MASVKVRLDKSHTAVGAAKEALMALEELTFTSHNDRDQVHAWVYSPVGTPRAIVQIVHGLGEHSRRYLHLITRLLDAGFVVAATDHVGHGKTAMESGIWVDTGETGMETYVEDEHSLQWSVTETYPDLPFFMFGHSWGSMIARVFASRYGDELAGLILGGIAAQMHGIESVVDREALAAALAADGQAPADPALVGPVFVGFLDRFGPGAGPTAWVAADLDVVADHGRDPLNNFGAPMSTRFLADFIDLYDAANDAAWAESIPEDLPVLILAGDQDPVANYGEGAYHVANALWSSGHSDVRAHVFPGARHEVHNEPSTRDEAEEEIVTFVECHLDKE